MIQSEWLAEARARLLRNAEIARHKSILDLGSGYGVVCPELSRRCGSPIFAIDLSFAALKHCEKAHPVCGNAVQLPFLNGSLDLVFSQNFLLWAKPVETIVEQVRRVLMRGGVWVLMEPDYGGMMEYPEQIQTRELWISILQREGADPFIGRRLPGLLQQNRFDVRTELLPRVYPPQDARFDLLSEMNLNPEEREKLENIKSLSGMVQVAHLPYFLIIAERC